MPFIQTMKRHFSLQKQLETDIVDRQIITEHAIHKKDLKPTIYSPKDLQELCDITRLKRSYIENQASIKNRIKGILTLVFPEYRHHFSNTFGKTSIVLLKEYPTADKLAHGHNSKIRITPSNNSHKRFDQQKADEIIKEAKNCNASRFGKTYKAMMLSLFRDLESINLLVEELYIRIKFLMENLNSYLNTIPGIGVTLTAEILGETEDINHFPKPSNIISYAVLIHVLSKVRILITLQIDGLLKR